MKRFLLFQTIYSFLLDKEYRDLLFTTFVVLGIGATAYHYLEGWSWLDSVYFCVITLTTIGYGDFAPQTPEGKLFTIFYLLVGLGIILTFINTVYDHYTKMKTNKKDENAG